MPRPFWQPIRQLLNLAVIHFFTAVFQRDEAGTGQTKTGFEGE